MIMMREACEDIVCRPQPLCVADPSVADVPQSDPFFQSIRQDCVAVFILDN